LTKFSIRITTAIATAAVILGAVAPAAFADTTITVVGNGAHSNSTVNVSNTTSTNVTQQNSSNITTAVNSTANTGGNKANDNTGGNVTVTSGDANSTVNVGVGGSSNTLTITPNCGCNSTANVTIAGNGAKSTSKVTVTNSNILTVLQQNISSIVNAIVSQTKTGKNQANNNTGPGDTTIISGMSTSNVTVNVTGSSNTASQ